MHPPSPTNLCDFPYYESKDNDFVQHHTTLPLSIKTTTRLPRMKVDPIKLHRATNIIDNLADNDTDEWIEACESYYTIADIGLSGSVFIAAKSSTNPTNLANTGANCCMTPNLMSLHSIELLCKPITVGVAVKGDKDPTYSQCTHVGSLPVLCDDGSHIHTADAFTTHLHRIPSFLRKPSLTLPTTSTHGNKRDVNLECLELSNLLEPLLLKPSLFFNTMASITAVLVFIRFLKKK
jgi:hypothetical protein